MESGWFVVIGAVIGVIPTVIVAWINQREEKERDLRQLALELALAEYRGILDHSRPGQKIFPPSVFVPAAHRAVTAYMRDSLDPDDLHKYAAELAEIGRKSTEACIKNQK